MNNKIKVFLKGIILPLVSYVLLNFIVVLIMTFIKLVLICIENYNETGNLMKDSDSLMEILSTADGFFTSSIIITGIAALLFFIIFYVFNYKNFLSDVNIEEKKFDKKNIKQVLMLSFGSSLFFNIILLYFLPFTQNNQKVIDMSNEIYNMNIFLAIFTISIIIPLTEEVLMRGYIFNSLRYIFNDYVGIFLSALLFGVIHGNITQGLYAFCVGLMLAIIYKIYKNIKYCFIFHIAANFFVLFLGPAMHILDIRGKIFLLVVSFAIMILSMYKIYLNYKNV